MINEKKELEKLDFEHTDTINFERIRTMNKNKLIIKEPERKYRHVFTRAFYQKVKKGYVKVNRVVLNVDERGLTFNDVTSIDNSTIFSDISLAAMYQSMEKIEIDDKQFIIKIIMPEVKENPSLTETFIDLKTLDGDLWGNYLAIKWTLEKFAKDKLVYGFIHQPTDKKG